MTKPSKRPAFDPPAQERQRRTRKAKPQRKPQTPKPAQAPAPAQVEAPIPAGETLSSPQPPPEAAPPFGALSAIGAADPGAHLEPGHLAPDPNPILPEHLAAPLTQRDTRLALHLYAGKSWNQALDLERYPPRGKLRDASPPAQILAAAEHLTRELAFSCGTTRRWIIENTVALYRRATQAEPVYDRRGNPTGEYTFQGATAAKCLEMLGNEIGMFGRRVLHDVPSDVRALMAAVAARGKPQLAPPAPRAIAGTLAPIAAPLPASAPRTDASDRAQVLVTPRIAAGA